MALIWNFRRGRGFKLKNLPLEGYGYFLEQPIVSMIKFLIFIVIGSSVHLFVKESVHNCLGVQWVQVSKF